MTDGHRELREQLGSYALGHLPDGEALALRAHLDGCAACRADLADLADERAPYFSLVLVPGRQRPR